MSLRGTVLDHYVLPLTKTMLYNAWLYYIPDSGRGREAVNLRGYDAHCSSQREAELHKEL